MNVVTTFDLDEPQDSLAGIRRFMSLWELAMRDQVNGLPYRHYVLPHEIAWTTFVDQGIKMVDAAKTKGRSDDNFRK